MVLKFGNLLNSGTARGGLYGFRLDILPQLRNFKAADGKATLIDALVDL